MASFIVAKKVFDLSVSASPKVLVGKTHLDFSTSSDPKVKILKKHFDYTVVVQFDANGGISPKDSDTFVIGSKYSLPEPTRYSCRFDGWFTAASGGSQITDSDLVSFSVTKLYAHWTEIDFSNGTEFDVVTTSNYKKAGIYSATRYSSLSSVYVDWGDGTMDEVDGNISQLTHEYSSTGMFRVRVTDNITSFAPSSNTNNWNNTTSQNRYTFKNMVRTGSHCTSMPAYAFYYCAALSSINFLSSCWSNLTSLPIGAFYYCTGIT